MLLIVKNKFILVKGKPDIVEGRIKGVDCESSDVNGVFSSEKGPRASRKYSPDELEASIINDDVKIKRQIKQIENIYVLDDGTRISVKNIIAQIAKTNKFDVRGEPIYLIRTQPIVKITREKVPPVPSAEGHPTFPQKEE